MIFLFWLFLHCIKMPNFFQTQWGVYLQSPPLPTSLLNRMLQLRLPPPDNDSGELQQRSYRSSYGVNPDVFHQFCKRDSTHYRMHGEKVWLTLFFALFRSLWGHWEADIIAHLRFCQHHTKAKSQVPAYTLALYKIKLSKPDDYSRFISEQDQKINSETCHMLLLLGPIRYWPFSLESPSTFSLRFSLIIQSFYVLITS